MSVSGGSVTEATISELTLSTEYTIEVAAVTGGNNIGVYSLSISAETTGELHVICTFRATRSLFLCSTGPLSVDASSTTRSVTISLNIVAGVTATIASYSISYSNTNNTQCFTTCNTISGITASVTMYTLTELQEATEYSITVTAILSDGETGEDSLTATTMAAG